MRPQNHQRVWLTLLSANEGQVSCVFMWMVYSTPLPFSQVSFFLDHHHALAFKGSPELAWKCFQG
jgi:hypothetical protein